MLGVVAPLYVPDLPGSLQFILDQIPQRTCVWLGGDGANAAVAGEPPPRMIFLDEFEAMSPHLTRLLEEAR